MCNLSDAFCRHFLEARLGPKASNLCCCFFIVFVCVCGAAVLTFQWFFFFIFYLIRTLVQAFSDFFSTFNSTELLLYNSFSCVFLYILNVNFNLSVLFSYKIQRSYVSLESNLFPFHYIFHRLRFARKTSVAISNRLFIICII